MASERGQASVEWTGLLLFVALGLAALTALAPRVEGRDLGAAVAARISCAARGKCASEDPRAPGAAAPATGVAAPGASAAPPLPRRGWQAGRALPLLQRVAGAVARRAWIACLGYRRYRYEREHPRRLSPFESMPPGEGLEIVNACLNPAAFVNER